MQSQSSNRKFSLLQSYHPAISKLTSQLLSQITIHFIQKRETEHRNISFQGRLGEKHFKHLQACPDNSKKSKCKSWAHLRYDHLTISAVVKKKKKKGNLELKQFVKTIWTCAKHRLQKSLALIRTSQKTAQGTWSWKDTTESISFCSSLLQSAVMMQKLKCGSRISILLRSASCICLYHTRSQTLLLTPFTDLSINPKWT